MNEHILSTINWTVTRSDKVRIGPLDLGLGIGIISTIMGPSGIGKTTFLLSLLGANEEGVVSTGRRYHNGVALSPGEVPHDALYIPQRMPFNPNWEIARFLSRLSSLNTNVLLAEYSRQKRTRDRRVLEVLRELRLDHRERATLAELSGGEAQRAAVAQMLLLRPKLLIGDEFVSALDSGLAIEILDRIRDETQRNNGAALLALHNVGEALQVSDTIAIFWPSSISATPWLLERHTSGWKSDYVFTLLCLSRWADEVESILDYIVLLRLVRLWAEDRNEFARRVSHSGPKNPLVVGHPDRLAPMDSALAEKLVLPRCSDSVQPLRGSLPGSGYIGVSLELDGSPLILTTLRRTSGGAA